MSDLQEEVHRAAERAVVMAKSRGGASLDYSEASLAVVEEILAEAARYASELSAKAREMLVEDFGSYVLEVARLRYGGVYSWMEHPEQPVLVFGEPSCHIAIATWDQVRGRLSGDPAYNIPFFYEGFSSRARKAQPGSRVLVA